jgi:hypothetical protein
MEFLYLSLYRNEWVRDHVLNSNKKALEFVIFNHTKKKMSFTIRSGESHPINKTLSAKQWFDYTPYVYHTSELKI